MPAGGLDSARLRFELMTPGILWIDDLHIRGETASKSARLNAQHTLLAALQAYREQRYADFARLAGSHWIRQSNIGGHRPAGTNERPAAAKVGTPRTARATRRLLPYRRTASSGKIVSRWPTSAKMKNRQASHSRS